MLNQPLVSLSDTCMQFEKLFLWTLSCHLLEIFQNKHAAIIHGKNAPRFVHTASTTGYGDPIVLEIKKKNVSVHMQCVCTNTHFISDRIKNQVKEDGLEGINEGYIKQKRAERLGQVRNGGKAVRNV